MKNQGTQLKILPLAGHIQHLEFASEETATPHPALSIRMEQGYLLCELNDPKWAGQVEVNGEKLFDIMQLDTLPTIAVDGSSFTVLRPYETCILPTSRQSADRFNRTKRPKHKKKPKILLRGAAITIAAMGAFFFFQAPVNSETTLAQLPEVVEQAKPVGQSLPSQPKNMSQKIDHSDQPEQAPTPKLDPENLPKKLLAPDNANHRKSKRVAKEKEPAPVKVTTRKNRSQKKPPQTKKARPTLDPDRAKVLSDVVDSLVLESSFDPEGARAKLTALKKQVPKNHKLTKKINKALGRL